jgi:23S rRNA pseudouridine1911/1915/1917 synthase
LRLDQALARWVPQVSRTRLKEAIEAGCVRIDGACVVKPAWVLEEGMRVDWVVEPRARLRPGGPAGAELRVLYEDADLALIDKPAGMVTHPTEVISGNTVSELAERRFGSLPDVHGQGRGGIVHRLDADTSGLLLLAKSPLAARELQRAFRAREVEKSYLAIVHGEPRFDSDWIRARIGRSKRHSDRMSVVGEGEGQDAETFYETLLRGRGTALLSCQPKTGRTHQLRVHLTHIDHPLVGDKLYHARRGLASRPLQGAPALTRHALHAARLAFLHPASGAQLSFESPLPADLAAFVEWMKS